MLTQKERAVIATLHAAQETVAALYAEDRYGTEWKADAESNAMHKVYSALLDMQLQIYDKGDSENANNNRR